MTHPSEVQRALSELKAAEKTRIVRSAPEETPTPTLSTPSAVRQMPEELNQLSQEMDEMELRLTALELCMTRLWSGLAQKIPG